MLRFRFVNYVIIVSGVFREHLRRGRTAVMISESLQPYKQTRPNPEQRCRLPRTPTRVYTQPEKVRILMNIIEILEFPTCMFST